MRRNLRKVTRKKVGKKQIKFDPIVVHAAKLVVAADKSGFPMGDYSTWTGDYNAGHPDPISWQASNYAGNSGGTASPSDAIEKEYSQALKGYPSKAGTNKAIKTASRLGENAAKIYWTAYKKGQLDSFNVKKEAARIDNIILGIAKQYKIGEATQKHVPKRVVAALTVLNQFGEVFRKAASSKK